LKTALQISEVCEEYLTSRTVRGRGYLEVFMNPTRDELKQIVANPDYDFGQPRRNATNHIRFSAIDETKDVYAWFGDFALHWELRKLLDFPLKDSICIGGGPCWERGILDGAAEMQGSNCVMISSDFFSIARSQNVEELKLMLDYDWRWVDRYIKVTPWLRDFIKQKGKSIFRTEIPDFPWM